MGALMNAPRPIDLAFAEINALGGYVDMKDREAVARDELLGEILTILERHGARDAALSSPVPFAEHQAGFISCGGF